MKTDHRTGIIEFGKLLVTGAALTGVLFFTTPSHLRADESECQHRISRADHRLHDAVEHHGWDSKQAEHARHELREARENCYTTNHRWWDEDEHRWRTDRDWDEEHGRPH
jgi:hypothetical protein